jgi:hypothetical protein
MNKSEIKKTVFELVDFIIQDTTCNTMGLSLTDYFWPEKNIWDPKRASFDDIGDYLVFVLWAGTIFKKKEWISFVKSQIDIWDNNFSYGDGWYQDEVDTEKISSGKWFISPYGHQDAILGFYSMYLLTQDSFYDKKCKQLLAAYRLVHGKNNGIIPNKIERNTEKALPWSSASPAVAGLVAEHAALSQDTRFARELIDPWLKTNLWKRSGFLAQGINSYLRNYSPYATAKIMKETSNMVYGMIALQNKYSDQIKHFIHQLLLLQNDHGGFYSTIDVKSNEVDRLLLNKTQNFTIIDLLCSLARAANEKDKKTLIASAKRAANYWIKLKHAQTGLIPDYVMSAGKPVYPIAKLDQSADIYSSLLRIFCLTNEKKYLDEAVLGAKVLKSTFGQSHWWMRIVSIKTGDQARDSEVPKSDQPAARNMTKYVGGALRFYLSLYEVLNGKDINTDAVLSILSRDR